MMPDTRNGDSSSISGVWHRVRSWWGSYIFEPFFYAQPLGQGIGLGLSVAYGIWRIGQGARLVLGLPAVSLAGA